MPVKTRWIVLHHNVRAKLQRRLKHITDAALRTRYLIVLHADQAMPKSHIAEALGCSRQTVDRVINRYDGLGEAGLFDRREDNGKRKASKVYLSMLEWILSNSTDFFGYHRPTWTHRLLIDAAARFTGVRISRRTMGRLLKELKVRRGRPKPTAPCPWPTRRRKAVISRIKTLIDTLPKDQVAVWEDEADIDLNPRIGLDYMLPGTQRKVITPGKNVKQYIAGAMDSRSDRIIWVTAKRKNSLLFIQMLQKLASTYRTAKTIHVICDNYSIHQSRQTQAWLREHGTRFRLHFLPPYCPDDNRIERKVWREMHANVTVNHQCPTMERLMAEVLWWLSRYNLKKPKAKAA
jgi:transposase